MLPHYNKLSLNYKPPGKKLIPGRQPAFAKKLRWLFLFFAQLVFFIAFSQKQDIKFDHLDINSGLSQNHIMCILQDSRGFMWFGTRDGLNKYDGYRFTVYKNDPKDDGSISSNFISAIEEDSKGFIWVATRGGGMNRYDKNTDKFIQYKNDPKNPNSIASDLAVDLTIDSEDNVWICAENGGLNYYEPVKNRFSHYIHNKNDNKSLTDNNTRSVFEDSKQGLWVGSYGGGLNLFDKETKSFTHFRYNENDNTSPGSDIVTIIFEDSKQRIWIGTVGGGLNLFDRPTGKFHRFIHDKLNPNSILSNVVFAINEDNAGNIWIGTENGGLSIYNPVTEKFYNYQHDEIDNKSISHNSVYSIYKDAYGSMWVGTFAGGLNIFNKDANRFAHYKHTTDKNSLSHNNVLCMAESKEGKIWIGTDGGGLNLYDPVTKNFRHFLHEAGNEKSICGDYVLSVLEDSKGNVWAGTWADGITVFNPQKNTYLHLKNDPAVSSSISSNNAWVIFEDRDKNIWVGTYNGGLNLYNPMDKSFTRFNDGTGNISTLKIQSITEDRKGNLWIGTDGGGLQVFDKKNKTFTRFIHQDNKNSLSDNRINNVYEDQQGNFWINTMVGLNYFDTKKQAFTIYNTSNGLPNNVIFGLLEDTKGNLWFSTNKGLSRFDPLTSKFKNFGVQDGLQSYEFKMRAFCKSRSGAMYFGGINGFNEFFPDRIKEDPFKFPLVFTDFQVFNKKVLIARNDKDPSPLKKDISETKEIMLTYKSSVISFEFASLSFSAPEKKQYAYMLEGFDKYWNEIGTNRTATYTNLDPGKYVFKVKGLDNEGNWSSHIASLQLTITPPFWLTWWFRITVLLAVGGSVFAFYRVRMNAVKKQQKLLEQKVKEQTVQLVHLHDEEHNARLEAEKSREEADHANQELGKKNIELEQFVYIASHDLREPLRTTTSFVELFQKQYKGKLDERADSYLSYITQSADRMKTLIDDLLDYSRIGSSKELEQVDCNIMLGEVLTDLGIALNEAGAEISSDQLPVISAHPTGIKQLFQNLIANGVKFRKKDIPPQIKISVQKNIRDWQFAFKDNGIGIDEKHKERIFLIFQRLHNRNEYEGSGIGLAHCKKIVELHGGKIWIESEPGDGTTFHFTIRNNDN
jgi:signal transduction histidine kinase/ligand-binding sensor domain-containing protein